MSFYELLYNEDFSVPEECVPKEYLRTICAEGFLAILIPKGETASGYLRRLCFNGLSERYGETEPKYTGRLEHELEVLDHAGLTEYFLIVHDLVCFAKQNDIDISPGRGALVGCLFSYCLGITEVDPVEYGLLFEKFINAKRVFSMVYASVVIDVEIGGYQKLRNYVAEKYGKGMPALLEALEIYISESRDISVIKDAVNLIRSHTGIAIGLSGLDLKDPAVYELFQSGDTDMIGSLLEEGMKEFLAAQKPQSMENLTAALALVRSGLEEKVEEYLKAKENPQAVSYEDVKLKPILEPTYGCLIFQEQIMEMLHVLGGFSYEQSDFSRRNMSKKKFAAIESDKKNFIRGNTEEGIPGCISMGISEEAAGRIFKMMEHSAVYTFNKSHAAAYALMAYRMAWLKYYYRQEFEEAVARNKDKQLIEWMWK